MAMNKEEMTKEDILNVVAGSMFDTMLDYVDNSNKELEQLRQENKQLKDNWNKLREWIVYHKHNENTKEHYLVVDFGTLLGKMRELENGDNNGYKL